MMRFIKTIKDQMTIFSKISTYFMTDSFRPGLMYSIPRSEASRIDPTLWIVPGAGRILAMPAFDNQFDIVTVNL